MLFYIYLIFLELSPVLAHIYSWLRWRPNVDYLWSILCLKFAGCHFITLEKSRTLALYEPHGCLFLSTRAENDEDLYTTAIDTYVTGGWALTLTPHSYFTQRWNDKNNKVTENKNKEDVFSILAKSKYNNIVVYPEITPNDNENKVSLYVSSAWLKQMSIQIILTHNKELVLDIKERKANYGINLYCYRSEVIRPSYFSNLEEFAEYVEMIWLKSHAQFLENI